MRTGIVTPTGYSSTYPTTQYSPGVWASCAGSDLQQLAMGYFAFFHYENGTHPASLLFVDSSTSTGGQAYDNSSTLQANGSSTNIPTAADHVLILTTGSTAGGAGTPGGRVGITTRPLGPVVPGGDYVWFEADVALATASTVTQGAFIGLTTLPALSTAGSTGTSILANVGSTASTNSLLASTGAIGFWMLGSNVGNFNAVWQNASSNGSTSTNGSTYAGGVSTVLLNVLTASTGSIVNGSVYAAPIGPVIPVGPLTSTQCQKLGLLFLPQGPGGPQVQWFVNGYQVCAQTVTVAAFDTISAYGGILEYGSSTTGFASTASTAQFKVDFFGAAAKLYKGA